MESEQYFRNDELKIYRGKDFVVSKYIRIHQCTLGEIEEYGEQAYYSLVYNLTATPQSLKAQLWQMEVDYTEITPWELFIGLLYKIHPQNQTYILFGDLDFTKFEVKIDEENKSIYLEQFINDERVVIDEYTYGVIIDYLCKSHFIKQDLKVPMNNSTKMILIEDAMDELIANKNKEYHSNLKNLISTMVNSSGFKYNHTDVWDLKINAFMDSVKRIGKIKNAELLLQSGYSGFGISLKDINKKELDWLGELE